MYIQVVCLSLFVIHARIVNNQEIMGLKLSRKLSFVLLADFRIHQTPILGSYLKSKVDFGHTVVGMWFVGTLAGMNINFKGPLILQIPIVDKRVESSCLKHVIGRLGHTERLLDEKADSNKCFLQSNLKFNSITINFSSLCNFVNNLNYKMKSINKCIFKDIK